jgi:hypothetical protein
MSSANLITSTSLADDEVYWSWDPESCTLVFYDNLDDTSGDLSSTSTQTLLTSGSITHSTPHRVHISTPPLKYTSRNPSSEWFEISLASDTSSSASASSFDDLLSSQSDGHFPHISSATSSANNSRIGLGISGLTKTNGAVFDGTGVVGLSFDTFENDQDEQVSSVSEMLIDEVAYTFIIGTSSPSTPPQPSTSQINLSMRADLVSSTMDVASAFLPALVGLGLSGLADEEELAEIAADADFMRLEEEMSRAFVVDDDDDFIFDDLDRDEEFGDHDAVSVFVNDNSEGDLAQEVSRALIQEVARMFSRSFSGNVSAGP